MKVIRNFFLYQKYNRLFPYLILLSSRPIISSLFQSSYLMRFSSFNQTSYIITGEIVIKSMTEKIKYENIQLLDSKKVPKKDIFIFLCLCLLHSMPILISFT